MRDGVTYGPKEVCQRVKISMRQLNYWKLIGVVQPYRELHRTKPFYRYSPRDLEILMALRKLTSEGYLVSKAAERVKLILAETNGDTSDLVRLIEEPNGHYHKEMAYFERRLQGEINRALRFKYSLSCVAIRLRMNSNGMGENGGILTQIERDLLSSVRSYEVLVRVAHEEFLWLLPQSTKSEATNAASRIESFIRKHCQDSTFQIKIGVSLLVHHDTTPKDLIREARFSLSAVET